MSKWESFKLPICFVFSNRQNERCTYPYYDTITAGHAATTLAVAKTKWNIVANWTAGGMLEYVEFIRTCQGDLGEIKLDVTLFLIVNGSDHWKKTFSNLLSETRQPLRISPQCRTAFQAGYVLQGEVTLRGSELFTPVTKQVSVTPQLSVDLLQMLENKDSFADSKLKCDTTEIPVHKCILSARSPVFDAMFKNKMKESEHGVVVIKDMKTDVLQAMLTYIYSGKTDHLTDTLADDLLFAAEKYQLKELKSICVNKLKKDTTVNNVIRVLVLGHLLDKSLEEHAKAFVCNFKNIAELENTEEWKTLLKERPALAAEVLMAVVKNLQKCYALIFDFFYKKNLY